MCLRMTKPLGLKPEVEIPNVAIGEKQYQLDFSISSENIDAGFIKALHHFEHYSGYGFAPVTALVTDIVASSENFKTMGKNTFNWKIYDEENDVSYVKFKVDRESDELIQKLDDIDWDSDDYGKKYFIDAICTFGLNVYKGEIHPQCVVKDYIVREVFEDNNDDDEDLDLDFDI